MEIELWNKTCYKYLAWAALIAVPIFIQNQLLRQTSWSQSSEFLAFSTATLRSEEFRLGASMEVRGRWPGNSIIEHSVTGHMEPRNSKWEHSFPSLSFSLSGSYNLLAPLATTTQGFINSCTYFWVFSVARSNSFFWSFRYEHGSRFFLFLLFSCLLLVVALNRLC